MIRRSLVLLALVAGFDLSAHAQVGVYGTFTLQRMGGLSSSPLAAGVAKSSTIDPIGGTFGVYYDWRDVGPVRLGFDGRGSEVTTKRGAQLNSVGSGARIYSALGGVRGVFHTPIRAVRPYLQASAGLGRTDYGLGNQNGAGGVVQLTNNFEYHVYGGVDLKLTNYLDFRAVEAGYGGLNPFGTNGHNYPLESLSSGIVIHFSK
jgi:hypothetical protein